MSPKATVRFNAQDSIAVTGHKKQGKTTWVKALLASADRPYVVLDPLGEYVDAGATAQTPDELRAALRTDKNPRLVYHLPDLGAAHVDEWAQAVEVCHGYILVIDEIAVATNREQPPSSVLNLSRLAHKRDCAFVWATHAPRDVPPVVRMSDWWVVYHTQVDRHVAALNEIKDGLGDRANQLPRGPDAPNAYRWLLSDGVTLTEHPPVTPPKLQAP